jgi:hypothetical protein
MFLTADLSKLPFTLLVLILTCSFFTCPLPITSAGEEWDILLGSVKNVTTRHSGFVSSKAYDPAGRLVETILSGTNPIDTPTRYRFEYDAQGMLMVETAFEPNGSIIYKNTYRYGYDDKGHKSAEVAAAADGTLSHAAFSIYDNRGNLESKIYFAGQLFTDKALFDALGNVIYGVRYRRGSLWFETGNLFGPDGLLRERQTYGADGSLSSRDMLRYDDGGRLIEENSEFFNSPYIQKSVTTYEYDTRGNWTRKLLKRWMKQGNEIKEFDAEVEEERSITYH